MNILRYLTTSFLQCNIKYQVYFIVLHEQYKTPYQESQGFLRIKG